MGKRKEIVVCCSDCGEVAPLDKEKTTDNWKVYDSKSPCIKCGGKIDIKF